MAEAAAELRRVKAINVPTYDKDLDRFVFSDGRVVNNNDPIFDKFKWAWTNEARMIKNRYDWQWMDLLK